MRVLAFGTFDGLHPGHEYYLHEAKKHGDELIVIVARDATVREVKGHSPVHGERERVETVRLLPIVDDALLGELGDKHEIVRTLKPDVITLGYDQEAFTQDLQTHFPHVKIVRIGSHRPDVYKSSKLTRGRDQAQPKRALPRRG